MSRKSRTPYAILGALSHGPKSGYDISQLFDSQQLFFWSESYGQIYPTLKRLLDEGLVDMQSEVRDSGPERKIYSLTEEGSAHLHAWVKDQTLKSSVRDEFMLKLYFTPSTAQAQTISRIEAMQALLEEQRDGLETEREELAELEDRDETLHRELATSWARHYNDARLAWCQESLARLGKTEGEDRKKKKKNKKKKNKKSVS